MKRRLDKSPNSRRCGAKKRSRALDFVAFGLPFVLVVLAVFWLNRPLEKADSSAPYDVALEVLENSTNDASCSTSTNESVVSNDDGVSDAETPDVEIESQTTSVEEKVLLEDVASSDVGIEEKQDDKQSVEESERLLARLEFQLARTKRSDETDVDSLLASFVAIRDQLSDLVENAPEETSKRARQTFDDVQALCQNLEEDRSFFSRLKELDEAALDSDATRAFFDSITQEFSAKDVEDADELKAYRRDFIRVANSLEALRKVERWNAFIEERGMALERFCVSKQDADAALRFMRDYGAEVGTPLEVAAVAKRERELEYAARNEVPTRRKVLLRIEAELAKKYWTYRIDEKSFYYLPEPPRVGLNEYVASAQGTLKNVEIPQNAEEITADESPQKSFLRELFARASAIPDETRVIDVAKWYREWCEILTELQRTDRLDPILQYALFRDVANILAASDYYFARRLEPLTRMLNVPQLADLSKIDIYQTEEDGTRNLRSTARMRMTFLPKDHLTVDKTTEQLDASVAPFAWSYRRIGWLDRNFAGEWRCRLSDAAPDIVGELWVFLDEVAPDDDSSSGSKSRWIKVGVVNGRQTSINLITSEAPRGAIVFCRMRTDGETPVAKRSGVERIFRR